MRRTCFNFKWASAVLFYLKSSVALYTTGPPFLLVLRYLPRLRALFSLASMHSRNLKNPGAVMNNITKQTMQRRAFT
jgi:hypothetical protein